MERKHKNFLVAAISGAIMIASVLFFSNIGSNVFKNVLAEGTDGPQPGSLTFSGSAKQIGDTDRWYTAATTEKGATYYLIAESDKITPANNCVASFPGYGKGTTQVYITDDINSLSPFKFQSISSVTFNVDNLLELTVYQFADGKTKDSTLSKNYNKGSSTLAAGNGKYFKISGNYYYGSGSCNIDLITVNFVCDSNIEPVPQTGLNGIFRCDQNSSAKLVFDSSGNYFCGGTDYANVYFDYEISGQQLTLFLSKIEGDYQPSFYYVFKGSDTSNSTGLITSDTTISLTTYNVSGTNSYQRTFTKQ